MKCMKVLRDLKKKWGEKDKGKKGGAKRLGCRGETSRHQIWGETTRGETTWGELVLGRNDLLPFRIPRILGRTYPMQADWNRIETCNHYILVLARSILNIMPGVQISWKKPRNF